jgi:hypothetical protein
MDINRSPLVRRFSAASERRAKALEHASAACKKEQYQFVIIETQEKEKYIIRTQVGEATYTCMRIISKERKHRNGEYATGSARSSHL